MQLLCLRAHGFRFFTKITLSLIIVVSIVIAGVVLLLGDQVLALYQQIAAAFG